MKKFLSILLALLMLMSISATAFAAEPAEDISKKTEATVYNVVLNSDGIVSVSDEDGGIMPLSSISGYASGSVTSSSPGFLVWVDASGIGGMGVTVKTSCPGWNGTITFDLISNDGNSHPVKGKSISTNGESQYHNLFHGIPVPAYYLANFSGIPAGYTVNAEVWIYG